ncbi:MAG: hypothetical protein NVSMB14_11930 [Isosphaeraceae bacterium]
MEIQDLTTEKTDRHGNLLERSTLIGGVTRLVVKSKRIPSGRRPPPQVNPKRKREVLILADSHAEVGSLVALARASG